MVTLETAENYLHVNIPLSKQLGVRVTELDPTRATLCAPLGPSLNHESNAFGGSISALAILAGWTFLYAHLESITEPRRIVIQRSQVEYLSPINGEFCATCEAPPPKEWDRFHHRVSKLGWARIDLKSEVLCGNQRAAAFEGTYVAMG